MTSAKGGARKPTQRGTTRPPSGRPRAATRPPSRWLLLGGALLIGVIAIAFVSFRRPRRDAVAALATEAIADSARAAAARRDWSELVRWSEALDRRLANSSTAKLNLGVALQNSMIFHAARGSRSHRTARNSLELMEARIHVLALMDTAEALAATPGEWVQAREAHGELLENLGLPLDALADYLDIRRRVPDEPRSAARIAWVRDRLVDPRRPDTVATR